jgi:hypothetical protein
MRDHAPELRDKAVREGMVAYALEAQQEVDHGTALKNALGAALSSYENSVIKEVVWEALSAAEEIDHDDAADLADDGVAALCWLAKELEDSIPMDDRE